MAAQQNFRTAFNGFNREDVVHYIEYLNTRHAAEVSQLNSELEYLRTRQTAPEAQSDAESAATIEQQAARIRELFDRCRELEGELEALKTEKAQQPQQQAAVSSQAEELEAYRRAERAERRAKERAELVYHQVNGTLADATVKVDDAATLIGEMTDRVTEQLTALQNAVTGSKQALKDAAATMYTLRPESEE